MTDQQPRRNPVPDRARRRAIRAQAARAGVPYSVASRQLVAASGAPASGPTAGEGRTVYPASSDSHRHRLIANRERRSAGQRVLDTRRAADLPGGRARHLVERFPPTRGEPGTGVGPLYSGEDTTETLAALYTVIAHESPGLVPSPGQLAWEAELGEETAVDTACADLDRAVRLLLDGRRAGLGPRIAAALADDRTDDRWWVRQEARRLEHWYRTSPFPAYDGARHILDAVLIVAEDGHAPGTRVRIRFDHTPNRAATIVGAVWGPVGPPRRYAVHPDGATAVTLLDPDDLVVIHAD